MDKRKVSVLVAGQRFNIITDEEEKYVIDIASKIDAKVTSISISQNMTRERAAVMTALDLADDIEQGKREMASVREQVKDYIAQIAKLTSENERLKTELSKAQLSAAALDDARATVAAGEKERESLARQIIALKEQIELMQKAEPEPAPVEAAPKEAAPEEEIYVPIEDPAEELYVPEEAAPADAEIPELPDPMPDPEPASPSKPAPEKAKVTADDDLFFDLPEEEPVKLPRKEKKNRHDHSHVNPYKQQFMQKQEKKGYTQQRQYSLFDNEE